MRRTRIAIFRVLGVALVGLALLSPQAGATGGTRAPAPEELSPAAATTQEGSQVNGDIIDFGFDPGTLTVKAGTKINWTNTGGRPHTVTDRGGTFDTDPLLPGASGSITVDVPGVYQFFCRINPGKMNGVLIVEPGDQPADTNRIQAIDPAREGKQLSFEPAELTVTVGSTIQFANVGGKPHTLTAEDGSFDTGKVAPGAEGGRFASQAVTFTVDQVGTFPFVCQVHPGAMKGVLTVVEGDGGGGGGGGEPPPADASPPPQAAAPPTAEVTMVDFNFDAPEVSVAPGGSVTWTNTGEAPHTATFDQVELDTGNVEPGATGSLTAPQKPGSYSYKCTIHPQMTGVVVVLAEGAADPTADAPAQEVAAPPANPPAAADDAGGSRGFSLIILLIAVLGAFLGGVGLTAFARARSKS